MQQGAETLVGLVIIALAVWLLARWRRGYFDPASEQRADARTPRQAFGVGLLHGIGGSAGVGAILLATIDNRALAVGGLVVLAAFTAVSMTVLTTGFGATLARRPVQQIAHPCDPGARRGQPRVRCLVRSRRSGAGAVLLLSLWRMAAFTISSRPTR